MFDEFLGFLKLYGVIGLAIAVIIGGKLNDLIKAIVDDLLMPFIGLMVPGGDWRGYKLEIGPLKLGVGHFAGAGIDFLIVAFVVFFIAKKVLKEETVSKR
jgi:large conductance mechanosensitive channel